MPCSLTLRNDETSAMVSVLRLRSSELDHDLDGFTIVHRTVAVGYAVDIRGAVEHESRLDSASNTSGMSSCMYARTGAGPPAMVMFQ